MNLSLSCVVRGMWIPGLPAYSPRLNRTFTFEGELPHRIVSHVRNQGVFVPTCCWSCCCARIIISQRIGSRSSTLTAASSSWLQVCPSDRKAHRFPRKMDISEFIEFVLHQAFYYYFTLPCCVAAVIRSRAGRHTRHTRERLYRIKSVWQGARALDCNCACCRRRRVLWGRR